MERSPLYYPLLYLLRIFSLGSRLRQRSLRPKRDILKEMERRQSIKSRNENRWQEETKEKENWWRRKSEVDEKLRWRDEEMKKCRHHKENIRFKENKEGKRRWGKQKEYNWEKERGKSCEIKVLVFPFKVSHKPDETQHQERRDKGSSTIGMAQPTEDASGSRFSQSHTRISRYKV